MCHLLIIRFPVVLQCHLCTPWPMYAFVRGGPERMGPRPPPWVPLLKNPIMVAVSFPPV